MEPVLYLVRHGSTAANSQNLFRGDSDIPLNGKGRQDAHEAVVFLQSENIDPDFIVCSDRVRATETADILASTFGHDPIHSSKLRAWDVGEFTGLPRDKENLAKLQQYIDNPWMEIPNGESLQDFRDRVLPTLAEAYAHAAAANSTGVIICHSSVIKSLGDELYNDIHSIAVEPGGVVVVGFDDSPESVAKRLFKPSTETQLIS